MVTKTISAALFIALSISLSAVTEVSAQDALVVESRSQELSDAEQQIIDEVKDGLIKAGVTATLKVTSEETIRLKDVTPLLKEGLAAYFDRDFDHALTVLTTALKLYDRRPADSAEIEELRSRRLQALTAVVLIHRRKRHPRRAKKFFETILREFPDIDGRGKNKLRDQNAASFGTALINERIKSRERLRATTKMSRLEVSIPNGGEIYLDLRPVGTVATLLSLIPGSYRLFAKNKQGIGAFKKITLAPGATLTVSLPLVFSLAAQSKGSPTLVFPDPEKQIEREFALASKLAIKANTRRAIVLSVRAAPKGAKWLVGNMIGTGGEFLRGAAISATATKRDIETFVTALTSNSLSTPQVSSTKRQSNWNQILKWGTLGCGGGALIGGFAIMTSGIGDSGFRNQGYGLMTLGGACLVGALVLHLGDNSGESSPQPLQPSSTP